MPRTLSFCALFFLACFTASGQTPVRLRLIDWADISEIPLQRSAIEEFERLHPGITVEYEPSPGRQYEQKLLTALAAGEPPDVFLLDSKLIPTFTNKQILLDLTPYLAPLSIDTSIWFSNVLAIARRGEHLYAFPKGFTPLMVYYNRALFRSAGVPSPGENWDWNDYLATAKALTIDRNGDGTPEQYGATFVNYFFYWIPWIWSGGGDVVNPAGTRASGALDSPGTVAALQFLINLRARDRVAPDLGTWVQTQKTGLTQALFASGALAMIVDGHWRIPVLLQQMREGTLDLGIAPLPRHPDGTRVNVLYESGWCVPVSSPKHEEAVALAAFMAGETACRIRAASRLEIPSVIRVAGELTAADTTGIEAAFVRETAWCRQPWGSVIERFSEIELILQDAVDEVMVNGEPIQATLTRYADRIDRDLAEIRANRDFTFRPIKEHTEILQFLVIVAALTLLVCATLYFRTRRRLRSLTLTAFSFLAPSLAHLVIFVFTPIAFAAFLSLHRWDIIVADKPYIGLGNFTEMATDEKFWRAIGNTLVYTLNVPLCMALSLMVALLLNKRRKGLGFLRTLYFLPSVTSFVAIALVWMWIYHPQFGVANFVLGLLGIPPMQWLNSSVTAMGSIIIFSIWMGIGYQMVIFLAGLQGIPEELYEAARIDGGGRWSLFRHVTWPLLLPTTFFILVTSLIGSFQVFTTIFVMTAGGPVGSTDVIVYHIYQAAWEQLRMGYASALSWFLFIIIMIATWIQFRVVGRTAEYS